MKKQKIICVLLATMLICLCSCGDDTDMATETLQVDTTETTTESTTEENILNTETEIYNDNNVVISVTDIVNSNEGSTINLIIENNSDEDYYFNVAGFTINGIMGDTSYGVSTASVGAGNKTKTQICISKEWLDKNNISEIATVDIWYYAYDDVDYENKIETGTMTIQTNLYDDTLVYSPSGEQIYDDTYITVWLNSANDNTVSLVMLNKSSFNAVYAIDDCAVNEWTYEITDYTYDYWSVPIISNSYAIIEVEIDDSFISEYGIDNVESFTFDIYLEAYSLVTFETFIDSTSDKITVNFE